MSIEEKIQNKIKELESKSKQLELKYEVEKFGIFNGIRDSLILIKYENQIEVLKSILN